MSRPAIHPRCRLTPDLQRLAAEAFGYTASMADRMGRRYSKMAIDWDGEIAVRICTLIGSFDESRCLKVWAIHQANFACRDALRAALGRKGRPSGRPRTLSMDAIRPAYEPTALDAPRPEPDARDDAVRLLRGLRPIQAAAMLGSYVDGRLLSEIARDHGVSESRMSQIRSEAVATLRRDLAAVRGGGS